MSIEAGNLYAEVIAVASKIESLVLDHERLEEIRATVLANFGDGAEKNNHGFSIPEGNTVQMVYDVFETLINQRDQLRKAAEEHNAVYELGAGPIEQARQIPLPQWVATRFIRIDGAGGHNEIVGKLESRICELEGELSLSLRCDECGGERTLNPSRNFYECLPCHQKRMEQQ